MTDRKKISFFLLLLTLCSCSTKTSGSSALSSSYASDGSSAKNSHVNEISSFTKQDRLDVLSDYDAETEEDFSGVTNVIDASTLPDGEVRKITDGGTYLLKGKNENARIVVDSTEEVKLILDNIELSSNTDAPLEIKNASSMTIHVAGKTKNYLTDTASSTSEACLLCKKVKLSIEGEGYLYVTSNGLEDNDAGVGIQSAKGLDIKESHIIVFSTSHALNAKAGVTVSSAQLYLTSKKDGIHSKVGGVTINASTIDSETYGDGIDAALDVSLVDVTDHFVTIGNFVVYDSSLDTDGSIYEDSKYILQNGEYKKISSDDMNRYKTRYYLEQKCKGVKSEAKVTIDGGSHYFYTTDDGIASDTEIDVLSGNYSFYTSDQAINSDQLLNIGKENEKSSDLSISIYHSYEGIQGGNVHFYDGNVLIYSDDDGINATSDTLTSVSMNFHEGSSVYVFADGDGIDSNGDINMSGGSLFVFGPTENDNGALDFDGKFTYTGGLLLAVGSPNMAQVPSTDSCNVVSYTSGGWSTGDIFSIRVDTITVSFLLMKDYFSMNVILGDGDKLVTGKNVEIYRNLTFDGNVTFHDYVYLGEFDTTGKEGTSSTVSSGLTRIGSSSNPGGGNQPGGPGGGKRP